jgi:signal transduction histidine kinase
MNAMMLTCLRQLLVLLSLCCVVPAMASVVVLDQHKNNLMSSALILSDPDGVLQFADVERAGADDRFVPISDVILGQRRGNIWFKIDMMQLPEVRRHWLLEVQPALFGKVEYYYRLQDGTLMSKEIGHRTANRIADVDYHYPVFNLDLPQAGAYTLYLNIQVDYFPVVAIYAWDTDAFLIAANDGIVLWGMYVGIFLLLMLSSLWFEKAIGDGVYGSFALYALSCILMTVILNGWVDQYLIREVDWLRNFPFAPLSILMGQWTFIVFFARFLGLTPQSSKKFSYFLRMTQLNALVFAVAFLVAFMRDASMLALWDWMNWMIDGCFMPVSALFLIVHTFKKPNGMRKLFMFASMMLVIGFSLHGLQEYGVFVPEEVFKYMPTWGSLFFSLIIFCSISMRYATLRREKEAAQQTLLDVRLGVEQALEKEVTKKASDLHRATETIEVALQQVRTAHDAQQHFVMTLSREMRVVLQEIDTAVDHVQHAFPVQSVKMQQRIARIGQSSKRLYTLVNDYLTTSRLDVISHGLNCREMCLLPLVESVVSQAYALTEGRTIRVIHDHSAKTVWADEDLLRLVLSSLIDNAIKYTDKETLIEVHLLSVRGGVMIDVVDYGDGIPDDERKLVFERYYRGRATAGTGGTGLGLHLARSLMRLHQGDLILVDTPQTQCRFSVFLPDKPEPD